jgi:hypothetical protein
MSLVRLVGDRPPVLGGSFQPPPAFLLVTGPKIPSGSQQSDCLQSNRCPKQHVLFDQRHTAGLQGAPQVGPCLVAPRQERSPSEGKHRRFHSITVEHTILDVKALRAATCSTIQE